MEKEPEKVFCSQYPSHLMGILTILMYSKYFNAIYLLGMPYNSNIDNLQLAKVAWPIY
jgi:hypothetical protein